MNTLIKKLKWFGYINKQKHENKLITRLKEKFGKDAVFVIGDWSNKGRLKFISTPNTGIKKKLNEHFKVWLIDEYKTSKICHKNDTECENISVRKNKYEQKNKWIRNKKTKERKKIKIKRKPKKDINRNIPVNTKQVSKDTKKLHPVLMYKSENISGCINRDRNAVMNMARIIRSLIKTGTRPEIFTRKEENIDTVKKTEKINGAVKVRVGKTKKQLNKRSMRFKIIKGTEAINKRLQKIYSKYNKIIESYSINKKNLSL